MKEGCILGIVDLVIGSGLVFLFAVDIVVYVHVTGRDLMYLCMNGLP